MRLSSLLTALAACDESRVLMTPRRLCFGGLPLSFSRPTHPDHVLHAFLGGAHSPWQTRRSVRYWMARSPHAYWCIYPRLYSLAIPLLRTKSNFGSLAKLFGRSRRPTRFWFTRDFHASMLVSTTTYLRAYLRTRPSDYYNASASVSGHHLNHFESTPA